MTAACSTTSKPDATSLVVSRDQQVAHTLQELLARDHHCRAELAASYQSASQVLAERTPSSVFLDLRVDGTEQDPTSLLAHLARRQQPPIPVIAIADAGYVFRWADLADSAVHAHLTLPLDSLQLSQVVDRHLRRPAIQPQARLSVPHSVESRSVRCTTHSADMAQLFDALVMMAPRDVTLLIVGETGTGKTTLARLVHELSGRQEEKFLTVACGALPSELIESELFGHVKGAFTSADRNKIGKFAAAGHGTLLLDEIDILGPSQQAKLLRVIESGEYEQVGANDTLRSETRLIAASNVDLKELMAQERFRPDLYYRLNVMQFVIPPLRERPLDIVPLALDFIEEFCRRDKISIRRIHPDFLRALKQYHWPGNVRELKNHLRRVVLFCRDGELCPEALPAEIRHAADSSVSRQPLPEEANLLSQQVAVSEIEILKKTLRENNYRRTVTAQALGISRVGLYKKMKKYGLLEIKPGTSGGHTR